MNALALAALLLLLWDPGDLQDPGFQLSFAATAGIIYLGPPLAERLSTWGWPVWLARSVAVSVGAQLAVTPVMLAFFNQLSLIGVVANLFVVPLAAPATTLGMLALLLSLVSDTLAGLCFNALWLMLVALRAVVWVAAAVPARHGQSARAGLGRRHRLVRGPGAGAALGPAPSRGPRARRPPPDSGGAVGRALVEARRRPAARDLPGRRARRCHVHRAAGWAAPPGRRRAGRSPAVRRWRARDRAVPLEPSRATARRGRALSLGRGSRGRARGHPPSLHGGRVLGKRMVATGRRGDIAGARALARAAAGAPRRQPTLDGRGARDGPQPRWGRADRRQR